MKKNLFFFFLSVSGSYCVQANTVVPEKPGSYFFCDTLAPAGVQVSGITLTTAVVSWAADPNTQNYIVRFRPAGTAAWSTVNVPSGQNALTLTNLMPCVNYEVQVAKFCNTTLGTWSAPLLFTTYLNYCAAASSDMNTVHLSTVTVTPSGGPAAMTSNSGASQYTDYRPDPNRKIQLLIGSTGNTISVTRTWSGTSSAISVRAWIDFNANGIFESNEMMVSSGSSAASVVSAVFNVPVLAFQTGPDCQVAMRVIVSETSASPVCGTFTYGEVEDYGVSFITPAQLSVSENSAVKSGSIYPNPSSGMLTLSGVAGDYFEIYNTAGQKVQQGRVSEDHIDVRELVPGTYFLQVRNKENTTRLKFIRQ